MYFRSRFPKHSQVPISGRFGTCYTMVASQKTKNKVILDVGSSSGLLAAKIKQLGFKKIIGVEPNAKAVKIAKASVKGVQFFVSTADKLPVPDRSVDIVCMFDVIEHVPVGGEMAALKEVSRVLKKGGTFLLTTPNDHWLTNLLDPAWYLGHRHYTTQRMRKFIKSVGLSVEKLETRGDIWSVIYILWFYVMKWIFRKTLPRGKWIEKKEDQGCRRPGMFLLVLQAKKMRN